MSAEDWLDPDLWPDDSEAEGLPDSPPYREPATRDEMRRFLRDFPNMSGRRYVHRPDRRIERTQPNNDNIRYCRDCRNLLLPYRPGKCPSCWRSLRTVLPASMLGARLCICVCRCPPEMDDPTDGDYRPELSIEEGHVDQTPTNNDALPELLARTSFQDHRGQETQRDFHAESLDQYNAASEPQSREDELSSFWNEANAVAETEASTLYRPPFRLELAVLLANGYTRDQIRHRFPETRDGRLSSYLPPDEAPYPDGPAACFFCRRDYSPELRTAISLGLVMREVSANIEHEHIPERLDQDERLYVEMSAPMVSLCHHCGLPIRDIHEFQGEPDECSCRCICAEVPSTSTGSSGSSGQSSRDVRRHGPANRPTGRAIQ